MQESDQTIMSQGNTISFEKAKRRPYLIVLYPQSQFKQTPLPMGSTIVGRGQDAQFKLEDELVSRTHCAITFDGIEVCVEDLGSTNGTFVDGSPVMKKSKLDSEKRLQIGRMVLKVEFKDPNEEAFDRNLFEAATRDSLTKISNRRTFMDRSLGELSFARRNNCYVHTIMIDVDHFKRINDTFGHQCGDLVLKEIARILQEEKRDSDLLARYGGEEFIMLFNCGGTKDAQKSAERIRAAIERHRFSWKDTIIPVTISLGLSSKQGANITTIDDLIAESDKLLYIAKQNGRNQVAFSE